MKISCNQDANRAKSKCDQPHLENSNWVEIEKDWWVSPDGLILCHCLLVLIMINTRHKLCHNAKSCKALDLLDLRVARSNSHATSNSRGFQTKCKSPVFYSESKKSQCTNYEQMHNPGNGIFDQHTWLPVWVRLWHIGNVQKGTRQA